MFRFSTLLTFTCAVFAISALTVPLTLPASSGLARGTAALTAEVSFLRQQNLELREAVLHGDAQRRADAAQIAGLQLQLSGANTDRAATGEEMQRELALLTSQSTESELRSAQLSASVLELQLIVEEALADSRRQMARSILKSRQHRQALRTIASLRQELVLASSAAGTHIVLETSGEMLTSSASVAPVVRPRPPYRLRSTSVVSPSQHSWELLTPFWLEDVRGP